MPFCSTYIPFIPLCSIPFIEKYNPKLRVNISAIQWNAKLRNKGAIIFLLENTFLGLLRQAIYILLVMKLYAILLNSETYCIYVLSSPCLISYNCNPSLSSFCKVVTSDKTKMWWCSHMHLIILQHGTAECMRTHHARTNTHIWSYPSPLVKSCLDLSWWLVSDVHHVQYHSTGYIINEYTETHTHFFSLSPPLISPLG